MVFNRVQNLYHIGRAKWYDPFKGLWNIIVGEKSEKALLQFLKENLKESGNILDMGCGTGLNLQTIIKLDLPFRCYRGLDFSDNMLDIARQKFSGKTNIQFEKRDLTDLSNMNEKFDIIICTWVISHLPDPVFFVNQAQKFLNKNGKMFLVFFGKPQKWINFWLEPLAKYLFMSKPIENDKITQFKNVTNRHLYAFGITDCLEIKMPI